MTESFRGYSQSFRPNAGIVPESRQVGLPDIPFSILFIIPLFSVKC